MYKAISLLIVGLFAAVYGVPSTFDAEHTWRYGNLSSHLPKNALIAGFDPNGYRLYVGRADYMGSIVPARVVPELGTAFVNTDVQFGTVFKYELLTTNNNMNYEWVRSFDGFLEDGAIVVGTNAKDEMVYICRVKFGESLLFGSLYLTKGLCYIKVYDLLTKFDKYEVLVAYPKLNVNLN